jgi:hypothetical protein
VTQDMRRKWRLLFNLSEEDRTSIELFIAGVRHWEIGLQWQVDNGKSKKD